jgi:hypothetical protein
MKTIMQELVDIMNADQVSFTEWFQDNYQMLIEKEKEQIIHAFNCGESFSVDYFNPETPEVAPSVNYFIQSYQNK